MNYLKPFLLLPCLSLLLSACEKEVMTREGSSASVQARNEPLPSIALSFFSASVAIDYTTNETLLPPSTPMTRIEGNGLTRSVAGDTFPMTPSFAGRRRIR